MEWLEHDGLSSREALPEWARSENAGEASYDGNPFVATFATERDRVETRRRRAQRDRVVGDLDGDPARGSRAVAHRGSAQAAEGPPWFELTGLDIGTIETRVRDAVDSAGLGYRNMRRPARPRPLDSILSRVLERDPVPGAVEIPMPRRFPVLGDVGAGVVVGSVMGLALLNPLGWTAALIASAAFAVVGAGVGAVHARRDLEKPARRVLVLLPEGFVGGLDGGDVRAVAWSRVLRFAAGNRR